MILINGNWENIESFADVSRIVREHFNSELANKLDEFISENDENISSLEQDIAILESTIDELEEQL